MTQTNTTLPRHRNAAIHLTPDSTDVDYYVGLRQHDPYYTMSDDYRHYEEGLASAMALDKHATNDRRRRLLDDYHNNNLDDIDAYFSPDEYTKEKETLA